MTSRFAIYAAPGTGSADPVALLLREKAEKWLGRSSSGDPVTPGIPRGWTRPAVDAITANARRYGFHATLKPPFRLADGRTPEELNAAVDRFAAASAAVMIGQLSLARIDGFFALVPGAEAPELCALADAVLQGFDDFRAPPNGTELARRKPASLAPRESALLKTWGYPYVLDKFRFHLTLTDRIQKVQRPQVESVLRDWFAALLGTTVPIDALAVFREDKPGLPFTVHAVHQLLPTPSHQRAANLQTAKELDDPRRSPQQRPHRPQ